MFRKEYGAPGSLFKELVAEDPAGFKNAMRMDSKKYNELILCSTQLFSRKRRASLGFVNFYSTFQFLLQCFRIVKKYFFEYNKLRIRYVQFEMQIL